MEKSPKNITFETTAKAEHAEAAPQENAATAEKTKKEPRTYRYDLHIHTKEGSLDAKAPVAQLARRLQAEGFAGMLVTDHNSYKGWKHPSTLGIGPEFTILHGIEYDTRNAGHVLVVLPDGTEDALFEQRGMRLEHLAYWVHQKGGVLGTAHPYGTGFFALMNTKWGKRPQPLQFFDFVETSNAGIKPMANARARRLAAFYGLPQTGGSDAHRLADAGRCYTDVETPLRCNQDFIDAVLLHKPMRPGGTPMPHATENQALRMLGVVGYWGWNKSLALLRVRARHAAERANMQISEDFRKIRNAAIARLDETYQQQEDEHGNASYRHHTNRTDV